MKLKVFLKLMFELLNHVEQEEQDSYEEAEEEAKKGHIYLVICKLRKEMERWQKFYVQGHRYILFVRREK